MDADFSEAMCYLVSGKGNNFYARVLAALKVRESRNREFCPSMMVALETRHLSMVYNGDWIKEAEFDEVVATIEHEALHVVLEHIPRKLVQHATFQDPVQKQRFLRITPFAEDMAVNCLLEKSNEHVAHWIKENRAAPWEGTKPGYKPESGWIMPEFPPFELPTELTYEQYVKLLMDKDEESENSGKAKGEGKDDGGDGGEFHEWMKQHSIGGQQMLLQLISHAEWEKMMAGMSDEEKQGLANEMKQRIRNAIEKAVEEHAKSRGTVPAFLEEYIEKMLQTPRVPWTQLLRDKVVNTKRWKWKRSIARPNRRKVAMAVAEPDMIVPFPGRSRDRAFTCVFCIDTSGSMGSSELEIALSELEHLRRADKDIQITIIESDADIGREYTIDSRGEIQWSLTGRGGTDFNPALERARELRPDICFYYTDGYAPAPEAHNRVACPMVWLVTPGGHCPDEDWGMHIRMSDD